jgi:hypothetical protein
LLGFEEDLDNFTLTLKNTSTQGEMLKIEKTKTKVTLYKDAVSDAGNGFSAMSMTRAKRDILGMSDDDIKEDLLEQRMEKAAAAELANSANVIKHTGMFDIVDRVYGDMKAALNGGGAAGGKEGDAESGGSVGGGGGGLGGSFGGGGGGAEDLDFGDESEAGAEGEEGAADTLAGGEEGAASEVGADAENAEADVPETSSVTESIKKVEKLIREEKDILKQKLNKRTAKYNNIFINRLVESIKPNNTIKNETVKIYDKNIIVNKDINEMISGIDKMLDE